MDLRLVYFISKTPRIGVFWGVAGLYMVPRFLICTKEVVRTIFESLSIIMDVKSSLVLVLPFPTSCPAHILPSCPDIK